MRISRLIRDERLAPREYHHFLRYTKLNARDRRIVKGIIRDERKHLAQLKRIKRRL